MKFNKITGLFSTPLGIVTVENVTTAEQLLLKIKSSIDTKNIDIKKYVEQYLMLIPQKVGQKVDLNLFNTEEKISYQQDILESLKSSLDLSFSNMSQNIDQIKNPFNVNISPILETDIINNIKSMFINYKDQNHPSAKLKFSQAFHFNIKSMEDNAVFHKNNGQMLWHGTRVGNILSIMKNGMKIIKSNTNIITGRMFGDGLYFSDISTKALNYSLGTWNGVGLGNKNKYYAIICSVYMGKMFTLKDESNVSKYPVSNYDSTFAPKGIKNLRNNEMIVYNENQVIPMYLVEFNL